jgi:N-methylhydantoinase B
VMISRVVDVVLACMSQAIPERARAGYGGCNAQPVFSGHRGSGEPFIFLDTNWGGMGASAIADGASCLSFPQNVANHPIELLESTYPVQIDRYEIRTDSAGAGEFRGGLGLIKDYRLTADARLDVPGDRTRLPPFGLNGGGPGALTEYVLVRDGVETNLPTKHEVQLRAGDVLSVRTSGGGGIGLAADRALHQIEHDLRFGYESSEHAQMAYGPGANDPVREASPIDP